MGEQFIGIKLGDELMMKKVLHIGNMKSPFQKELFHFLKLYGLKKRMVFKNYYFAYSPGIIGKSRLMYKVSRLFLLENFIYDLLFVEFLGDHAYYSALLNLRRKPIVVRCHRTELFEYWEKYRNRIVYSSKNVNLIICVSQAMLRRLTKLMPWVKDKSMVIYNSVDPLKFKPMLRNEDGEEKLVIGSLGNLIPSKGFHGLVMVVKRLIDRGYSLELRIGGKGPLEFLLKKLIKRYDLEDRIILDGFIPHKETPKWYNSIDLFILNSRIEGMPTVVLEAMSSGLPVIATAVGGIPEALDKKWLYYPGDLDRLMNLIVEIYNMPPDERRHMGLTNRHRVLKYFDIRKNSQKIIDILARYFK